MEGPNLTGDDVIIVKPGMTENYSLIFSPSSIGDHNGRYNCEFFMRNCIPRYFFEIISYREFFRLVFFNEMIGEFWFKLDLKANPPVETTIPLINCELGKYCCRI